MMVEKAKYIQVSSNPLICMTNRKNEESEPGDRARPKIYSRKSSRDFILKVMKITEGKKHKKPQIINGQFRILGD